MFEGSNRKALIVPDEILDKWQQMVDLIAEILKVPTVIITRIDPPFLKAIRTNLSRDNPVPVDYGFPLGGDNLYRGIYCEWVITQGRSLSIDNALEDTRWHHSLGSRFGLISYFGLPLLEPDGTIFGTICAMDSQSGKFTKTYKLLMAHFKDLVESQLQLLHQQSVLERQVADLEKKDAQLLEYRDHLEELVAQRTRELASTNATLLTEIEERRNTEKALKEMDITHTRELEHLMRTEDKMSSLGRVATGIAHEIRNPLSAMNMYLKALEAEITDVDAAAGRSLHNSMQIFQKIKTAALKMEGIIKRVMDFSKPTAPMFTDTNLNLAIMRVVDLCGVTVRKAGIQLETHLCPDLPNCLADQQMIEQVLLNLMNNATHALAHQLGPKTIRVTSEKAPHAVIAKVSDSGAGVPPDIRDMIFDPFFTTRKTGSGVGLSLVRRIIIDHGGAIELATSEWGGAEFVVTIPLSQRSAQR